MIDTEPDTVKLASRAVAKLQRHIEVQKGNDDQQIFAKPFRIDEKRTQAGDSR
ncbi:hypothetical protein MASR1M12_37940 [Erysipelotrichia bacterium]